MEDRTRQLLAERRNFMKSGFGLEREPSDQKKGLTQPPLFRHRTAIEKILLPEISDFNGFAEKDYFKLLQNRRSRRKYTGEAITLSQLAFLLWSVQGVRLYRENMTRTARPVPSAGARHPFETYIQVNRVEGLLPGLYHYAPDENVLELIRQEADFERKSVENLEEQIWTAKSSVIIYWTCDIYRSEYRYDTEAHRMSLVDLGHLDQNLYLSAEALGLGACCIGAYGQQKCDDYLGVDGEGEFTVLAATVGQVNA
ncbi:MAG: SagB/ThcOx family dehydrogenase [Lachnospiraceae bacterium]|nr:SagB/ThcOx family dehydrogenase [Lachnospiraceae bacterium]